MEGTVRWYSAKGFGFIDLWSESENDVKSFYFHVSRVKDHAVLKAGTAVSFDVVKAPKGPTAINVQPVLAAHEGKSNVESQLIR
jgi:cold shock protein